MNCLCALNLDKWILVIGFLTLVWLLLKRKYTYWDRSGFATVPGYYYLTGHFKFNFGRKPVAILIDDLYKATDESIAGSYFFLRPRLIVRDPELIRLILVKDFSYFIDRLIVTNEENDSLNKHLFILRGAKWKNLRPKLTPTFTSGKLKAMFSTLVECGSTLQKHLDKLADRGELLDIKEVSACYATNVIASVAFGIEIDAINNPNNEFRVCGRNILKPTLRGVLKRLLLMTAPKITMALGLKLIDPEIENFIMSIVKQNLEYRETNNVSRKDFFQLLIQLRNTGTVQLDDEWDTVIKTNEHEKTMTIDEMAAQVFIFFIAGFETSSSTLSFCLYELARNADIQQRVHDEIDRILTLYNGQITYESVSEMKFLESCIEETLRLYPILAFLSRASVQDDQIPGTNKIIKKGEQIMIPVFSLHRDEKYYSEPNKFNPDRFSDETPAGKDQLNQPYLPFGDGPRNCIGMRLGKMQTKVGLVLMLQKYKYELGDDLKNRDIEFDPNSFLLSTLGGIHLKLSKR